MAITVHSPFSGRPVKIRDQDVRRAVRDEEGRVFYVLPRSSGGGYYAAVTRKGSERDEQRYDDILDKAKRGEFAAQASQAQVHDARGPGRPGSRLRAVVLLLILLVIAGLTYYVLMQQGYVPAVPGLPAPLQPLPPDALPIDPGPPIPEAPAPMGPAASLLPVADASVTIAPAVAATPVQPAMTALPSGLRYRTDARGEGAPAQTGEFVRFHLELALPGGPVLYSSRSGQPLSLVLGYQQLGRGMDEGVLGMAPGERRTLLIPHALLRGFNLGGRYPELPAAAVQVAVELIEILPGLQIRTVSPGQGEAAGRGDIITLACTARVDGRERPFATGDEAPPLTMTLGQGKVIAGLELGVLGMTEGETREIVIPPHLGYGSHGFGQIIPAEATLRYQVTLLKRSPAQPR